MSSFVELGKSDWVLSRGVRFKNLGNSRKKGEEISYIKYLVPLIRELEQ